MYRHRQSAAPLLWLVLPALSLVLLIAVGVEDWIARMILATVFIVVGLSAWCFSSLTVLVDSEHLRWHFGPGLIRKSIRLEEIEHVEPTRTTLLSGWGIHWTPRGWLYNVAGFDAVSVHLHGGRQVLIGTDEPEQLVEALKQARFIRVA